MIRRCRKAPPTLAPIDPLPAALHSHRALGGRKASKVAAMRTRPWGGVFSRAQRPGFHGEPRPTPHGRRHGVCARPRRRRLAFAHRLQAVRGPEAPARVLHGGHMVSTVIVTWAWSRSCPGAADAGRGRVFRPLAKAGSQFVRSWARHVCLHLCVRVSSGCHRVRPAIAAAHTPSCARV